MLKSLPQRFKTFLSQVAKEGIDMTRMHSILERQKMQLLESVETDPADVLSTAVLSGEVDGRRGR